MNSTVRLSFNEKITKKWDLCVLYTIYGTHKTDKKTESQNCLLLFKLPATVHMNSSRCPLIECAAAEKKKKKKKKKVEET